MSNDLDEPLDLPMTVGNRFVRLVTTADGDVTALFVGAVAGASEVWVRLVDEEALLLEGGQSSRPAEILIGVRNCPDEARSHVGDVIRLSKAASVHVEPRADHVSPAVISRPLKAKPRVRLAGRRLFPHRLLRESASAGLRR